MHFSEVLDGQGDPGKHARACTVLTFNVGEANNKSKSTIGAILANDNGFAHKSRLVFSYSYYNQNGKKLKNDWKLGKSGPMKLNRNIYIVHVTFPTKRYAYVLIGDLKKHTSAEGWFR